MRINQLFIAKLYNPNKPERGFTPGTRKKKRIPNKSGQRRKGHAKKILTSVLVELRN